MRRAEAWAENGARTSPVIRATLRSLATGTRPGRDGPIGLDKVTGAALGPCGPFTGGQEPEFMSLVVGDWLDDEANHSPAFSGDEQGFECGLQGPHPRSASASPSQRGSNENTNGLLRQYPKGTDLSAHSAKDLKRFADSLNNRPRKTLGCMKPSEQLAEFLALSA
jgi:hypothetical protein